ncbi:MAG: DNA ligase [Gammaproteobacteria bacterium]|nr:DNA ligase [Gammaproteobacteria bacterium]
MQLLRNFPALWILCLLSVSLYAAAPDLLLLKPYRPGMQINGWLMSEKLDGVRAYWDGSQLLSRQGNRLHAPDWFRAQLPPFKLDGELWIGRGRFEQTLSIVSSEQADADWDQIHYHIFELPQAQGGLIQRLSKLQQYLTRNKPSHLHLIPQHVCRDRRQLLQTLSQVEATGGEGLVLRNPLSPYHTGRSDNALKVKSFEDMEAKVIGYTAGKGKYAGKTGALRVEIEGGIRFLIGSGLSNQQRSDPPPLGSTITFKYQGFTANGIPRFASFLRIRPVLKY